MRRQRFHALCWGLLAMLAACASPPERPDPEVPPDWFHASETPPAEEEMLATWWESFRDPELTRLVRRALHHNRDVRQAMLRVAGARAQLGQARSALLPSVDLTGSGSRQWTERDSSRVSDRLLEPLVGDTLRLDNWELAVEATWEVDLFGATRARAEGARQQLRATQAEAIAARLAVAANAAQGYIQLRALERQQGLLEEGIDIARELERVSGLLFHAGDVTRLDVESSAAERVTLEAQRAEIEISLDEARLALDTLLAQPHGSLAVGLSGGSPVPLFEGGIPPGQPLDLLRRRPDLIAAAAELDAADQQALAARRDLFPQIALQASAGRRGLELDNLVSTASNFALLGATFILPLLDFGRRQAAIDLADVEGASAYLAFEQALADALEEVERGLVMLQGQQRRLAALEQVLEHRERTHDLAQRSYRLGEADLTAVLDAQRALLDARQQIVDGRTAVATAQVALFVALGGGWQAAPEAASDPDAGATGLLNR